MKKTIIATLMLLSLSSFAGSGVGEISAGGMKDYANLTITGKRYHLFIGCRSRNDLYLQTEH
jgi:hypothetical protein